MCIFSYVNLDLVLFTTHRLSMSFQDNRTQAMIINNHHLTLYMMIFFFVFFATVYKIQQCFIFRGDNQ